MKSQMKFQKILALVTLVIAALSIVLALFFCSGILYAVVNYSAKTAEEEAYYGVQELYEFSQSANNILVIMGIVLILIVAAMYIMGNAKRRNYYISNIVATYVYVVYAAVYAIAMIAVCAVCFALMGKIDFETWKADEDFILSLGGETYYTRNVATLVLGLLLSGVLLATAVAWVLNLVWKIKLMKGEKQLLEQNGVASTSELEVA